MMKFKRSFLPALLLFSMMQAVPTSSLRAQFTTAGDEAEAKTAKGKKDDEVRSKFFSIEPRDELKGDSKSSSSSSTSPTSSKKGAPAGPAPIADNEKVYFSISDFSIKQNLVGTTSCPLLWTVENQSQRAFEEVLVQSIWDTAEGERKFVAQFFQLAPGARTSQELELYGALCYQIQARPTASRIIAMKCITLDGITSEMCESMMDYKTTGYGGRGF